MDRRLDAGLCILVREGSEEAMHACDAGARHRISEMVSMLENQQVDSLGQPASALLGPSCLCLYLSVLGL